MDYATRFGGLEPPEPTHGSGHMLNGAMTK